MADGDADRGHAVHNARPRVGASLGEDDESAGGEVVRFPTRRQLHRPAVCQELVRRPHAELALGSPEPRGDLRRGRHFRVGPTLPVALPAKGLHVLAERTPAGLLARRGPDDPHPLPGLGDVRARSGPTLQHSLEDQQLCRRYVPRGDRRAAVRGCPSLSGVRGPGRSTSGEDFTVAALRVSEDFYPAEDDGESLPL